MAMTREILPGIYTFEIPLPKSPLKALNSYVVKSKEHSLIIDTGWNQQECLDPMLSALEEIKVDRKRMDLFITHLHADHSGLAAQLAGKNAKVYFGQYEASIKFSALEREKERFERLAKTSLMHGFPEEELRRAMKYHPALLYKTPTPTNLQTVEEGDTIKIGEYSLRCIGTPGHSPGHMCLYEEKKKILFAGDHILFDITPNITRWPEMENPLEYYFASLQKVYDLAIEIVLPGHRSIMNGHRERIGQIRTHHRKRLEEALRALESGDKTAWDVAPFLTWNIDFRSWDDFPPVQKWFALGETLAHLNYLAAHGSIRCRRHKDRFLYSRLKNC